MVDTSGIDAGPLILRSAIDRTWSRSCRRSLCNRSLCSRCWSRSGRWSLRREWFGLGRWLGSWGFTRSTGALLELAPALVDPSIEQGAHSHLPILRVELIMSTQLSITVIHDATCPPLTILERMGSSEVVPQFVRKRQPRRTGVNLVRTCSVFGIFADL